MRWIFAMWAAPLVIFWGWFALSFYNIHFGYVLLSRPGHDLVFELYGNILGIDPATIPWLAAKACVFDTLLLLTFWAFRRRRQIAAWLRSQRERYSGEASSPNA